MATQHSRFYTLWICPAKGSRENESLSALIEKYSKAYKTPLFSPHLTLHGGLHDYDAPEIRQRISRILSGWSDGLFPIWFTGTVVTTDEFFRSVVLEVVQSPELMKLNSQLRKEFDLSEDNQREYFPHVSIVYSDEQQITTDIKERDIKPEIESGKWWCNTRSWHNTLSYEAIEIHVVDIAKDVVGDWEIVDRIQIPK